VGRHGGDGLGREQCWRPWHVDGADAGAHKHSITTRKKKTLTYPTEANTRCAAQGDPAHSLDDEQALWGQLDDPACDQASSLCCKVLTTKPYPKTKTQQNKKEYAQAIVDSGIKVVETAGNNPGELVKVSDCVHMGRSLKNKKK